MSRLSKLAVATCALCLTGVLVAATGSAAGRAGAGPQASVADVGATSKGRAARRRCLVRKRAARRRSVARCARIRRAAVRRPVAERLAAVAPGTPALGGDPGGGGQGDSGGSSPALGRFVSVAAREWSFKLSRPVVAAGSVTVELRNVGEDPHNLVVGPDDGSHSALAGWADTEPGALLRQAVTLPAGQYLLWCSLAGHEQLGMSARLRVE